MKNNNNNSNLATDSLGGKEMTNSEKKNETKTITQQTNTETPKKETKEAIEGASQQSQRADQKQQNQGGNEMTNSEKKHDTKTITQQTNTETPKKETKDAIEGATKQSQQTDKKTESQGGSKMTNSKTKHGTNQTSKSKVNKVDDFDFDKLTKQVSEPSSFGGGGKSGVCTIVYNHNGKRITPSNEVYEVIGSPTEVSIAYDESYLYIMKSNDKVGREYPVKKTKNRSVIYCGGLLSELVKAVELDFSNKTSLTFYSVEYIESKGITIAKIQLK